MKLKYYSKALKLCKYPKKTFKIIQSLQEMLQSNQCVLEGKALPVSLLPLLLNKKEIRLFQYTSEVIAGIIEKTLLALSTSPRIKEYISYESIPQKWLEVSPGYKRQVPIARFDAIFDGKNLKYIEFHTDSPGAQAWGDTIRKVLVEHPFYRSLSRFPDEDTKPSVLATIKEGIETLYKEFTHKASDKISVAFADYEDSPTAMDTLLCTRYLSQQGMDAFVADPRQFTLRDGVAYCKGKKVDIVRRVMKSQEFLREQSKNENFIKGCLEHTFCMINPFRSIYGGEKALFALITNPEFQHLYTKKEIEIIKHHIPWTRMLSEQETTDWQGEKIVLSDFVKNNRERLVMKTTRVLLGKDVFLGIETDPKEWEKNFLAQKGNKDWIVQEYVPGKEIPMPCVSGKKIHLEKRYFTLGSFVVNGKFCGILGRFADIPLVHLSKASGFLPVLQY
ncbi:MAG: hypothetical protein HUU50_19260 [Candidatus Brocadiae bacterium]|nr:hypothetical protein [Candidatus Brocadiia bacterium]